LSFGSSASAGTTSTGYNTTADTSSSSPLIDWRGFQTKSNTTSVGIEKFEKRNARLSRLALVRAYLHDSHYARKPTYCVYDFFSIKTKPPPGESPVDVDNVTASMNKLSVYETHSLNWRFLFTVTMYDEGDDVMCDVTFFVPTQRMMETGFP
jgi:hypothetical protein